ncbi:hypothetical protein B0T21DRAFT_344579 [Apiosordaria backusii]|uniref:Uncharacterized protein n=1 Tax=Apiosordaria backusii TaxID=314023 RepID=A0AA40K3A8_9PEZI|nr:hypothetical protein B0T21DRAFT_344579 [Apiosordaria backusii]
MSYNTPFFPTTYPIGEDEHARLKRQLAEAKEDLDIKKAELASAREMMKQHEKKIFDLNYKLSLGAHRVQAADAGVRQTSAQHMSTLEELNKIRQALMISETKLREVERTRDEATGNYRQLSLQYYPAMEELSRTRQLLSSTQAQLKEALTTRAEARGALNLREQVWYYEKAKLESKYESSQTQLRSVQAHLESTEGKLREALKVHDEASKAMSLSAACQYEASKFRDAYEESQKNLHNTQLRLTATQSELEEALKARDMVSDEALKLRMSKLKVTRFDPSEDRIEELRLERDELREERDEIRRERDELVRSHSRSRSRSRRRDSFSFSYSETSI